MYVFCGGGGELERDAFSSEWKLLKKVKWKKVQTWKKDDFQSTKGNNKRDQSSVKSDQVSAGRETHCDSGGGMSAGWPRHACSQIHSNVETDCSSAYV